MTLWQKIQAWFIVKFGLTVTQDYNSTDTSYIDEFMKTYKKITYSSETIENVDVERELAPFLLFLAGSNEFAYNSILYFCASEYGIEKLLFLPKEAFVMRLNFYNAVLGTDIRTAASIMFGKHKNSDLCKLVGAFADLCSTDEPEKYIISAIKKENDVNGRAFYFYKDFASFIYTDFFTAIVDYYKKIQHLV
jgi:hypothetical protein